MWGEGRHDKYTVVEVGGQLVSILLSIMCVPGIELGLLSSVASTCIYPLIHFTHLLNFYTF